MLDGDELVAVAYETPPTVAPSSDGSADAPRTQRLVAGRADASAHSACSRTFIHAVGPVSAPACDAGRAPQRGAGRSITIRRVPIGRWSRIIANRGLL